MALVGYKQLQRTRRCVLCTITEHQHCSSRDSRTVLGTKIGGNRIHLGAVKGVKLLTMRGTICHKGH